MTQIKHIKKPNTNKEIFSNLHPIVAKWFKQKFGGFTEAQKYSVIPIKNRKNILVSSPTGSGKTLCAFTSILNHLITLSEGGKLEKKSLRNLHFSSKSINTRY